MRISQLSIEEVREAANIVEVASEFTALKRQGTNFVGLCPYPDHSEKTPSFSVSPEKSFYHCFGCGVGGDAIKLVMELKSFSFVEAVSHLAERFGVELKFEGRSPEEAKHAEQHATRRRLAYKALAAATAYYHKYLLKAPVAQEARRYLEDRGLERSTIEEFRIGYAPPRGRPGFAHAALKVGLGREALGDAGLVSPRGGERFLDRVTFPISDKRGRIVGFGARSLGDAKPKYLNSPETELFNKRSLLYGFPQVVEAMRKEKTAVVVEGYTDVLMLYQSGIKNAVATLGTALTDQHLKALSGYAERIYLLTDPDAAGEGVLEKSFFPAAEMKLDLRVLRLPEDPADWLLSHSAEEFHSLFSNAPSVFEYVVRKVTDGTKTADSAGRARALQKVKDLLRRIEDPVLHRDSVRLAAESLGVTTDMLLQELRVRLDPQAKIRPPRSLKDELTLRFAEVESGELRLHKAGRELLALIFARPDLAAGPLREGVEAPGFAEPLVLDPGDFSNETHARIFALLAEHASEDLGTVLADERARPLLDEISALQAAGEKLYPSLDALRAAWFRLAALSREKAKLLIEDFDEKYRLHVQIRHLNEAAVEASNRTLEPS